MAWVEHAHADPAALAEALAGQLEAHCLQALAAGGRVWIALAGGRTPLPAYRAWAGRSLDWSRVTVLPTDERCVPHGHPACNATALADALAAAHGVSIAALTTPDGAPAASLAAASALLAAHPQPFDLVVLGLGADGHTASLFPGARRLRAALDPDAVHDACRLDPEPLPPEAPFPRISLTLARLLRTRAVHVAISGEDKREALRRAQASRDALRHPIAGVLHAPGATVHVHWSP